MLARLEAHVAEQQRFAANASHELRTPLAITQTLLDVARNDPNRDNGELVDRLHFVNTRAIDLTEALLLLSRADQRSFAREHVDLSLIAEEATETLLPFAEKRGVTIETSGDAAPTIGSPALLLQMTTNLVHNAIVHNLAEQGTVWVTTSAHPESVVLTVENTGEKLTPQLVATLVEPFRRGTERIRTDHAGVGLGLAIVKSITQAHDGTLTLTPRAAGGLCVTVQLPTSREGTSTWPHSSEDVRLLDGYVAPIDGSTDWVAAGRSPDGAAWLVETLSKAGAHLVGAATYAGWAGFLLAASGPFAEPMNEIPKVVFSNSLASADWGETTIVAGDLAEAIARLKQERSDQYCSPTAASCGSPDRWSRPA